jgi:hypothetical protein
MNEARRGSKRCRYCSMRLDGVWSRRAHESRIHGQPLPGWLTRKLAAGRGDA